MGKDARFLLFGTIDELFPTGREAFNVVAPGQRHAVRFRFLVDKAFDRIDLCIQIDDETALKDIEAAWPIVLRWRELIRQDPEHNPFVGTNGAYFRLWQDHKAGASYGKLAERINDKIASYLLGTDEFLSATDEHGEPLIPSQEIADLGRYHALDILRIMQPGRSERQREETVAYALSEIRAGRPPFLGSESPVTYGEVRDRIQYFEIKWRDRLADTEKLR